MSATINLIDKYKVVCSMVSDNACAASLKVTRGTVSGWRVGKSHPNAEAVELMCKKVGEPLQRWLPLIEAERARTPADKKVWLRLAQAAAAIVLVTNAAAFFATHNPVTLYIMYNYITLQS